MMRELLTFVVIFALCSFGSQAQSKNWKDELTKALKDTYPNTKTATFERNNITQPGVALVVLKENIMGENVHNSIYRISTVENGNVSSPKGLAGFISSGSAKGLKVGEKVYVRDIDIGDDSVKFQLLTLDMYDVIENGTTKRNRLVAVLNFKFPKPQLSSMKLEEVKKAIDAVLLSEELASAPKSIELGQTFDQVERVLGKPEAVAKLGNKTIYTYKNMKVTFIDGKVADVQ